MLPGAEAVAVSARTGAGLDALRRGAGRARRRAIRGRAEAGGPLRLHVDRVFTIRGAGTVVTGTLWSGTAARGDAVTLLPSGLRTRVRGVQVHDRPVDRAEAGQRVALNLVGVSTDDVARGDVVVAAARAARPSGAAPRSGAAGDGGGAATFRIDAALEWASPEARPDGGARVGVHHGTREVPARLAELGGRYAQLRLEQPLVPAAGDRLVIRSLAPPDTLGGGVVLDPSPPRHGPSRELTARLARLERGEPEPEAPAPAPAPAPEPEPLSPAALAVEDELLAAGHEPPLDADLDADASSRPCATPVARFGSAPPCTCTSTPSPPCGTGSWRCSGRGRGQPRPLPRRARHLAQVRPGVPRALRRRAAHAAPRRRAVLRRR